MLNGVVSRSRIAQMKWGTENNPSVIARKPSVNTSVIPIKEYH